MVEDVIESRYTCVPSILVACLKEWFGEGSFKLIVSLAACLLQPPWLPQVKGPNIEKAPPDEAAKWKVEVPQLLTLVRGFRPRLSHDRLHDGLTLRSPSRTKSSLFRGSFGRLIIRRSRLQCQGGGALPRTGRGIRRGSCIGRLCRRIVFQPSSAPCSNTCR